MLLDDTLAKHSALLSRRKLRVFLCFILQLKEKTWYEIMIFAFLKYSLSRNLDIGTVEIKIESINYQSSTITHRDG